MKKIALILILMLVGCANNSKYIGSYGKGEGKIDVYSFHTSHVGTPAVTGIAVVKNNRGHVVALFNQKDLTTVALEGLFGVASSAAHGMTFGMFRRPDKTYVSNSAVGQGSGSATAKASSGSTESVKEQGKGKEKDNGNNGKGNGDDPQPPGDPKKND